LKPPVSLFVTEVRAAVMASDQDSERPSAKINTRKGAEDMTWWKTLAVVLAMAGAYYLLFTRGGGGEDVWWPYL
jgi:hypothetical protein